MPLLDRLAERLGRQLRPATPAVHLQWIRASVGAAVRHVAQVVRGANETADVHLRGRPEVLPVSRSTLQVFRPMQFQAGV